MDQAQLVERAMAVAAARVTPEMDSEEKDGVLESAMMELLERQAVKPFFGKVAFTAAGGSKATTGLYLMHDEPRLPKMPERPTLIDFFERRILLNKRGGTHLLQSAALAQRKGLPDKIVLACLLHDIAVVSHVRSDHGYYGAQLIEPYVDAEIAWAVRYHQALRFYPAPELGYEYPDLYVRTFGEDYVPPPYIAQAAAYAQNHEWYMTARLVTMNDLYAFDPSVQVDVHQFEDVIGRAFRQPEEGLGFDGSASAHMWRSIIWPNNFL